MSDHALRHPAAVLDAAHLGDIKGALGTIRHGDLGARRSWWARLRTLLAILGPGLIVMVGDNDAGAFGTYTQAGQNYGTALLWTLLLLVPVLYVNQEMVLRLGAVTGVGHARLILERFGKFWGAFSVIDLFLLNTLTIITEFIGVNLALGYLGVPKAWGILVAAGIVIAAASTGSFRRFERFSLALCFLSLLLVPVFLMAHPPLSEVAQGLVVPRVPAGAKLSDVMLLIIAVVGTTIAPWQLFFQQSYVIDKRITPRFIAYEKADLWLGIVVVVVGAVAMMAFAAAAFQGTPGFGQFTDAGAVAVGLERHAGRAAGVMFAIALLDASIIGASAVSLSTAYALGDVLALRHSLHRKPTDAWGFYLVYGGVVTPRSRARAGVQRRNPRPADQRRADARGRAAALGHGVPAAAVQRPRRARAVGERQVAQYVHGRGDLGAGHAVPRADGRDRVPRPERRSHRGLPRGGHGGRLGRRRRRRAAPPRAWRQQGCEHGAGGRRLHPGDARDLAHAAARRSAAAAAHHGEACLDGRAARLPGRRCCLGGVEGRSGRDGRVEAARTPSSVGRSLMIVCRALARAALLAFALPATACQSSGQGGTGPVSTTPSPDSNQTAAPVVRQSTPGGASQAP